jgi:hypothetical protein
VHFSPLDRVDSQIITLDFGSGNGNGNGKGSTTGTGGWNYGIFNSNSNITPDLNNSDQPGKAGNHSNACQL